MFGKGRKKSLATKKKSVPEKGKKRAREARNEEESSEKEEIVRFVSARAEEIYKNNRSKPLTMERGIDLPVSTAPFVRETLMFYGWFGEDLGIEIPRKHFARQPDNAAVEIVHEFYANLRAVAPNHGYKVIVREKEVDFSPARINAFFSLEEPEECWYGAQVHRNIDWEMILESIARPGTRWMIGGNQEPVKFDKIALRREYRVLFMFLSARLSPSTHHSHVTKDKALLLYALVNHHPVNVGSVICASILESANGTGNRGYCMPSLITSLCVESGVVIEDRELWAKPKRAIDIGLWHQMKRDEDQAQAAAAGGVPDAPGAMGAPPTSSTHGQTLPTYMAPYMERQDQLSARVERMEGNFAAMQTQQQSQWERQQAQWEHQQAQFAYTAGCFDTMHHMMVPLMETQGHDIWNLPQRPGDFVYHGSSAQPPQDPPHGDE